MMITENESMNKAPLDRIENRNWVNPKIPAKFQKFLSENNACYVLITCGMPTEDGKMQVEMTYEGDVCLAAYLVESAQGIIDEKTNSIS